MRFFCFILFLVFSISALQAIEKRIAVCEIREAITPVTERYIKRALEDAGTKKFDAVIFEIDTPGGLLDTTRNIVQALLSSKIDTIAYVSPSGARAGSAGVFITMSARYAAMAPACNIGAAHPVTIGSRDEKEDENSKHLSIKIENDSIAFIESIAKARNRNIDWAKDSVKNSVSITSDEALKKGVINFIAADDTDLVRQIYGSDKAFLIMPFKKNWAESLLSILSNPNLVYFLMILGFYGILYEIIHPGTIFSGATGALLLITALYSMQYLPFNFAGLILIVLAFILIMIEVFTATHGLLIIGAMISLIIGSAMLFDSPFPFLRVSYASIAVVALTTFLVFTSLVYLISRVLYRKAVSGKEGMSGRNAVAITDFILGRGKVFFHGETWYAVSENDIKKDSPITING
ncbi:MAG: nodulation protein NfeD, partial [Brevinematales bacterium]